MSEETAQTEGGEGQEIGAVSHVYDRARVVAIILTGDLVVGDKILFAKSGLEQTVDSMQIDHNPVEEAHSGDHIGIKYDAEALGEGKIREGEKVLKVE